MSYLIVSAIGAATFSGYWFSITRVLGVGKSEPVKSEESSHTQPDSKAQAATASLETAPVTKKHEPPKPVPTPKPIARIDNFSTIVPINIDAPQAPIPMDENMADPRSDFYSDLMGLAMVPQNALEAKWPVHEARKIATDGDRFNFSARLIQFYVLQQIQLLQRGSKGGIKQVIGQGVTPINRKPIPPPDSTDYPAAKLLKMLEGNEFLTPSARMIFDHIPFNTPEGTAISFFEYGADPKEGKLFTCVIRLERPSRYKLEFVIQPSMGSGKGVLPNGFQTQIASVQSYSVTISMALEVARTKDSDFDAQEYVTWASDLFAGLEKRMGFD